MPDDCVLALAKNAEDLTNLETLISFLKPWYGIADRFAKGILVYIQKTIASTLMFISNNPTSIPASSNYRVPSRAEQRAILKAAQASKRLRYLDDPVIAAASEMIARRDEWLIKRGKPTPATKVRRKKAADLARREEKKEEARHKKV